VADDTSPVALVVIGSSAGGIEALQTLAGSLRPDFPAPIVIAQHLDPARPSRLAEILAHAGTLRVCTVEHLERLEAGVIYVVPANEHVEITDSHVGLRQSAQGRPKPSVDVLLTTAARSYGERLIAVILSGTGSDGAEGARVVKDLGGVVIVQNPTTASFAGMPRSLAPSSIDFTTHLEQIGPLLADLLSGAQAPPKPDDERAVTALLQEIRAQRGVDFTSYKLPTIMRRLQRRIVATNSDTLAGYLTYLRQTPDEYQRLVSTFLIKVTDFFRDADLFAHLRTEVLPTLIAASRAHDNELRLWSAGCATGEEAYSLAILVCELLGDEVDQFAVRIFATDLDPEAVAFARRGVYTAGTLSGLSAEQLSRHFTEVDGAYEVKKRVRGLIVFGQHDLGQRPPFPRIDLALCRNVLIYFAPELQRRALQIFAFSLRDGGYLVLGKAETTSPLPEYYTLEQSQLKIYRRHGDRVIIPLVRMRDPARSGSLRLPTDGRGFTDQARLRAPAPGEALRSRTSGERAEALLLGLPVGIVQVDRNYDVQLINSAARRLLGVHSAAIGEDLIHLVQSVAPAPLRAAIDTAFQGERVRRVIEVAPIEAAGGETRHLELSASVETVESAGILLESVTLLVEDCTEGIREQSTLRESYERERTERTRLGAHIERLAESNRQVLTANEGLTVENAELRSGNEELLVATEEIQAATEEVETLNEELQATNEALETLNEELQATVEELNTTNDDLQARGLELQELTVSIEEQRRVADSERARLMAVLQTMRDAVLVVDTRGTPTLTNSAYAQFFGSADQVFLAEDEAGHALPPEETPQRRAGRGESFDMEFYLTAEDGTRRAFDVSTAPFPGARDSHAGVLVIRDISARNLVQLQEQFMAMASHELRTPLTSVLGYLQLLDQRGDRLGAERSTEITRLALGQARRLRELVNDLLDIARLRSGRLTLTLAPFDLRVLAQHVVELTGVLAHGQTITLQSDDTPLTVNGESDRIEQVLINLLTNAIAYAPDTERIDVRLRRAGTWAELEVQDYGRGIPAALQPHLFTRFHQGSRTGRRGEGGLGLGLYIAREIIVGHGGTIAVRSREGEGATFIVRLPIAAPGDA